MDAQCHPGRKSLLDILIGIEAGILGGILMLIWLMLISPLIGEPWWLLPNLFASTLYGDSSRQGPGMVTVVGSAVHLIGCGFVGVMNGLLTPGGRLFGLGIAAAWYLLCYLLLWKRIAPLALHGSQPVLIAGYFLLGSALGQHTALLARARTGCGLRDAETGA